MTDEPQPFYAKHKVVDLTCPHCTGILTFLVNERERSIYSCRCGRWIKTVVATIDPTEKPQWVYERNEAIPQ